MFDERHYVRYQLWFKIKMIPDYFVQRRRQQILWFWSNIFSIALNGLLCESRLYRRIHLLVKSVTILKSNDARQTGAAAREKVLLKMLRHVREGGRPLRQSAACWFRDLDQGENDFCRTKYVDLKMVTQYLEVNKYEQVGENYMQRMKLFLHSFIFGRISDLISLYILSLNKFRLRCE